jgi:phosphoribosylanthranilate isomerase
MALKSFVKISGINNLSDARYCAGMTVDILGFSFEPAHPDYIDPNKFTAITEWLSGVAFCAEFEMADAEQIRDTLEQYPEIDYLQITNPDYLPALKLLQKPIILRLSTSLMTDWVRLEQLLEKSTSDVTFFLFERDTSREIASVKDVLNIAEDYPVLLGFGLEEDNVQELLEQGNLKGIALRGGDEIKPGYKDFDELADILEAIEIDDLE